jgi:hypothetical protein
VTQSIDNFFRSSDEIFKPTLESETFELFSRDRGNPIFELFSIRVFHDPDIHSMTEDFLLVIDNQSIKQLVVFSRETSECLRPSVYPESIEERVGGTRRSDFRKHESTILEKDPSLIPRDNNGGAKTVL